MNYVLEKLALIILLGTTLALPVAQSATLEDPQPPRFGGPGGPSPGGPGPGRPAPGPSRPSEPIRPVATSARQILVMAGQCLLAMVVLNVLHSMDDQSDHPLIQVMNRDVLVGTKDGVGITDTDVLAGVMIP
jgi:hypothetical protein